MNRLRISREWRDPAARPLSRRVEVADPEVQPEPIHPVSRGAALILGGLMVAVSVIMVVMSLVTLFTSGWAEFLDVVPYAVAFIPLWLWLGRKLLRAGRTGLDPDSEDRAMEAAESRAFLAAVEKHKAEGETPPGHAPPRSI